MSSHAWLPASPCGPGCRSDGDAVVGPVRHALRWAVLVLVLLVAVLAVLVVAALPRHRVAVQRRCAATLLRACGVRLRVSGAPEWGRPGAPVLVVAEHVSWLDALALPAVAPVGLVSRADLAGWPVVGALARRGRTVFLDRSRLRLLPGVVAEVATELGAGRSIAVFPEGTTWCGGVHGRFRPALFQAAVDADVPVLPLALRYRTTAGTSSTAPAFIGEDTLLASVHRVLGQRGLVLELVRLPLEQPGRDRRELAARCGAAVARVSPDELPPVRVRPEADRVPGRPAHGHESHRHDDDVRATHQVSASPPSTTSCRRTISASPQGSSSRPSRPSTASG